MELNVHLLYEPKVDAINLLRSRLAPNIRLTAGASLPKSADFHILVAGRPSAEQLAFSPNLQCVIVPWSGIPPETKALMQQNLHIALHNLHHNAAPVAEMTLALLLGASKFLLRHDAALRQHDWRPRYEPNPSLLLAGKTAVILGYGAIGQRVAKLCTALEMQVLATRRSVKTAVVTPHATIHPAHDLLTVLPQATVLIVALPHTSETENLIGQAELALLPQPSVLVNIGRAAIINESALYEALSTKQLTAAALDVWYQYPKSKEARVNTPPSAYPFHELDNVVLSPHRAGGSTEGDQLRMAHLAHLLNAAAQGHPIPNRVDLEQGY